LNEYSAIHLKFWFHL